MPIPIVECEFSPRTYNVLRRWLGKDGTLEEVAACSRFDVSRFKGVGEKVLAEIEDILRHYHLNFCDDPQAPQITALVVENTEQLKERIRLHQDVVGYHNAQIAELKKRLRRALVVKKPPKPKPPRCFYFNLEGAQCKWQAWRDHLCESHWRELCGHDAPLIYDDDTYSEMIEKGKHKAGAWGQFGSVFGRRICLHCRQELEAYSGWFERCPARQMALVRRSTEVVVTQ